MHITKQREYVLETVKKCLIFYEPVVARDPKSKKFIVFKNKYCATCNDFDQPAQQCPSEAIDQLTQVPASFNIITSFDANYLKGSFNTKTNQTCATGEVYNPLRNTCQSVIKTVQVNQPKLVPSNPLGQQKSGTLAALRTHLVLLFIAFPLLAHFVFI